jgi:hypothetical protein
VRVAGAGADYGPGRCGDRRRHRIRTFDQLAGARAPGATAAGAPQISLAVFEAYVGRIRAKAKPGEACVGGVLDQHTPDHIIRELVVAGERVVMAGGAPSYVVQDMNATPRTSGTLILTTHALYWQQSAGLRRPMKGKQLKRFDLLNRGAPAAGSTLDGVLPRGGLWAWHAEACRAGPFGLGVAVGLVSVALSLCTTARPLHTRVR